MTNLSFSQEDTARTKDNACARYALCVFASLYTFWFVGAIIGWGPMQRMLEESGAFSYMCPASDDGVCPAQAQTIINLGFLATTFSIVTPLVGHAVDHYGAPTVSYGMSLAAILGTGLLIVAAGTDTSWLYWLCFALLALTTFTGSLLSVQVGMYFQGHTQVRVIMWLNALFDAGTVSYLFLWMIELHFGASFVTVTIIYFLLAIALFVPSTYFWTVAVPEEEQLVAEEISRTLQIENEQVTRPETSSSASESLRFFTESKMNYPHLKEAVQSRRGSLRDAFRSSDANHFSSAVVYGSMQGESNDGKQDKQYILVADRSATEQLLSTPYILLVFFFSVSQISCNWTLITAADFLASLEDDGMYLKLFTLMQPASMLALPLVDFIIRYYGFGSAFQCVNLINFVYIFIKCTSTNLRLHIVTFFMVAAVRCFLYASTYSFLPSLLTPDVVGRGTGFLSMVGGIACFLNLPLNLLAAQGDFFIPNVIYLLSVFPCTLAVRHVQHTITRESEIKEARMNSAAVRGSKL